MQPIREHTCRCIWSTMVYNIFPPICLHPDAVCRLALLGYAGIPMLESIPCFFITLIAGSRIHRIYKTQSSSQSGYSRGTGISKDNFSPAPVPRSFSRGDSKGDIPLSPLPSSPPPTAQSPKSTRHTHDRSISQHSRRQSYFSFGSQQPKSPITPISTVMSNASHYNQLEEPFPTEKRLEASGIEEIRQWEYPKNNDMRDSERTPARWDSKHFVFECEPR